MLFEIRGIMQNALLGIKPLRRRLHRFGSTGMNGDPAAAQARLDHYSRNVSIAGKRILELGPGHTPEVLLLARDRGAARCVGLDVEHVIEPLAFRERGVELDLYDGLRMPYPDGSFDIVWSSDVLEHVRNPEFTVRECHRILRPGGVFASLVDLRDHYFLDREEKWLECLRYSDVMWRAICSNRSSFVNRLRVSEWNELLVRTGFAVELWEKQVSEILQRLHRNGGVRSGRGPLTEDDAATYRVEFVAKKHEG